MILQSRIDLLEKIAQYLLSEEREWIETKNKAYAANGWFTPAFIQLAAEKIARNFLSKNILQQMAEVYHIPVENNQPQKTGLVLAGNIPLVGFHDLLAVFITGNRAKVKPSAKDDILIRHLVEKMISFNNAIKDVVEFSPILKGCDAYIATGSNNSSRYFEFYFSKYPHIIRRNKTSVAVLTGDETKEQLDLLADDILLYFGLGCRNVTKIYVPENYDFVPLLDALKKYSYFFDHHKYKNNFDYNLAIHLLNNKYYMSNGFMLLVEESSLFSPISQLNYETYRTEDAVINGLKTNQDVQCIVGKNMVPFGQAQNPGIFDYADGIDTMQFLTTLPVRQLSE
jgi:Acyl-CoA reductase (LuxC).